MSGGEGKLVFTAVNGGDANEANFNTDRHKVLGYYSLVPRPFPPPVFDRLQIYNMQKRRGKAWEKESRA